MANVLPLLKSLYSFVHEKLGFNAPVNILLQSDVENATKFLGKTGHYHPKTQTITIYTDRRHLKDILRSISHELIHHDQNCNGAFEKPFETGPGYAQSNSHLRELERDAYERGNMLFRDWEDKQKWTLSEGKTETLPTAEKPAIPNSNNQNQEANTSTVSNKEWYNDTLYKSLVKKWIKK